MKKVKKKKRLVRRWIACLVNDWYVGDTRSLARMSPIEGVAIVLALDALDLSDHSREASLGSGTPVERDMDGIGKDRV